MYAGYISAGSLIIIYHFNLSFVPCFFDYLLDSMMPQHLFHVLYPTSSNLHHSVLPSSVLLSLAHLLSSITLSLCHSFIYVFHLLSLAHLPSSVTSSFLSSVFHPFITCSIFHFLTPCPFVLFLSLLFQHLFITPCLPIPTLFVYSTFCPLWLCESFSTFSILPHLLYYSKPCSI